MRRVAWTSVVLALALTGVSGVARAVDDPGPPRVAGAVQVTQNPTPVRAHSSPQIAVNPDNGELVVVESDVRGSRACSVHLSVDGGRTWAPGGNPMVDPYTDCGFFAEYGPYATTAFGPDGTLFVAFVASELLDRVRNDTPRHVFLARSDDGGRTFTTSRVFDAPDGNIDRGLNKGPMLAVDPNDESRVYVGWRQGVFSPNATEKLKSNVAASDDGGRTFGAPVDLTDERGGDYPAIAVDGDGTVHAVYWTRTWGVPPTPEGGVAPLRPIMYSRSRDGGATFSAPAELDAGNQSASRPAVMAADPRSGNLYVAWHGNAEPNNQADGFSGDLDVFVRTSTDGGATWGDRVVVNDDTGGANQFEPGLSVAPNGRLDVAWYDFRHSPTEPIVSSGHSGDLGLSDVYMSSSTDGGRTFGANVRVSDRSADRSYGVWSNRVDSKFNVGIASSDATVYVAWQDTRNAIGDTDAEDVYTTSVHLAASPGAGDDDSGVPGWILLGSGTALGLGLAASGAWLFARRSPPAAVPARVR